MEPEWLQGRVFAPEEPEELQKEVSAPRGDREAPKRSQNRAAIVLLFLPVWEGISFRQEFWAGIEGMGRNLGRNFGKELERNFFFRDIFILIYY